MKSLCQNCNQEVEFVTEVVLFSNGTEHIKGECSSCKRVRFLPQKKSAEEYVMPFGKHKGKRLCDIPMDYIKWLVENNVVKGGLMNLCKELSKKQFCSYCKSTNVSVVDDDGSKLLSCTNCGARVVHRE